LGGWDGNRTDTASGCVVDFFLNATVASGGGIPSGSNKNKKCWRAESCYQAGRHAVSGLFPSDPPNPLTKTVATVPNLNRDADGEAKQKNSPAARRRAAGLFVRERLMK
jgi:hypothetical protein